MENVKTFAMCSVKQKSNDDEMSCTAIHLKSNHLPSGVLLNSSAPLEQMSRRCCSITLPISSRHSRFSPASFLLFPGLGAELIALFLFQKSLAALERCLHNPHLLLQSWRGRESNLPQAAEDLLRDPSTWYALSAPLQFACPSMNFWSPCLPRLYQLRVDS